MLAGAAADDAGWRAAAIVIRDRVFQDAQSGHCPAHFTLCAPHSEQTYADFAFAIRNALIYKVFLNMADKHTYALEPPDTGPWLAAEANDSTAFTAVYYIKMPTLSH